MEIDLKKFAEEKKYIMQYASQQVAEKIEYIEQTLRDIKTIVELSGIEVKLKYNTGIEDLLEEVDSLHPEWNSSSMYC